MNVQPLERLDGAYLPDPWRVDAAPQPSELAPFLRFVSANVQEHTSEHTALSKRDALAFGRFLVTHGLSFATVRATLAQLVGERRSRVDRRRRAELLDRFQWDVFEHYHRRVKPRFATFFSNSTAHFQHLAWDEMENDPEGSLVLRGYQQMDRMVDRALQLADGDATVVLCTALSQTANRDDVAFDGFYRLHDPATLVERVQLSGVVRTAPVMAGQCHLYFDDLDAASTAAALLESATLDGQRALDVAQSGTDLLIGCPVFVRQPTGLDLRLVDGRKVSFDDLFYWNDAPREGTHHPDGILWIQHAHSHERDARVPLTAVAPTLLSVLGVDRPPSMHDELLLAGQWG